MQHSRLVSKKRVEILLYCDFKQDTIRFPRMIYISALDLTFFTIKMGIWRFSHDVTNNGEEDLRDRIEDVAPVASGHTHPICEADLGCSCGISRGVDRENNGRTSREASRRTSF
jgi:hypothetical protein